jgi:hypothetical protein
MLELKQQVTKIDNKTDFVEFTNNLANYVGTHSTEISEINVISYIRAISAWTNDMNGYYDNIGAQLPSQPSWRLFGEILIAALIYE